MRAIDRAFAWVRSRPFFYRFTLFTRVLLVAGIVPTGMVKLLGRRFTVISPDDPIGAFFEAMFQTGLYWQFIGASQVAAALLLLWPRFAHLGGLLFVPIMTNIFVITVSLGFTGTPFVTGAMVLAAVYLCAWDWHRFRSLFTVEPLPVSVAVHRLDRWEWAGFVAFGASLLYFFLATRGLSQGATLVALAAGFASGAFTLGRFLWIRSRIASGIASNTGAAQAR